MTREMFERHGGFDERFTSAGGGISNLEIFQRFVTRPKARNICLLSEGTFHQVHDAVATSGRVKWDVMAREYETIFGYPYKPRPYDVLYQGRPRPGMNRFLRQSLHEPGPEGAGGKSS